MAVLESRRKIVFDYIKSKYESDEKSVILRMKTPQEIAMEFGRYKDESDYEYDYDDLDGDVDIPYGVNDDMCDIMKNGDTYECTIISVDRREWTLSEDFYELKVFDKDGNRVPNMWNSCFFEIPDENYSKKMKVINILTNL